MNITYLNVRVRMRVLACAGARGLVRACSLAYPA
jgi:hypothetical protein